MEDQIYTGKLMKNALYMYCKGMQNNVELQNIKPVALAIIKLEGLRKL